MYKQSCGCVHHWVHIVCMCGHHWCVCPCVKHTPHINYTALTSACIVCTRWRRLCVCASPPVELLQRASTLCVWCGRARRVCTRVRVCRTTLCCRKRPRARCVVCVSHGSATHTLNKGTEMLHNAQWLTRSLMLAHHTAVAMSPPPPITKTRSPWTTADMRSHRSGSDGPKCQVCVFPS